MIARDLPLAAVIDSNILIDFLNGVPEAQATLAAIPTRYVSVVTRAEILSGAKDAVARAGALQLLALCRMVDIDTAVADRSAALRQASRLKLPDALIAATAASLSLPLVTRDTGMIAAEIEAIIPYQR